MIAVQFAQAIEAAGLTAPDIIHVDGKLHRFSPTGKRGDQAAWYVVHADGLAAGAFGCWRTGLTETWCSKPQQQLSAQERSELRQRVQQAKSQRDQALLQRQQMAQEQAKSRWSMAQPVIQHPYLKTKGVAPYGLKQKGSLLLVPLHDSAGLLHSLQTIGTDSSKRFLSGGRVRGCYYAVGQPAGAVVVAEGVATAHSIHAATKLAVAAAFSATNLAPVAQALRRKYPALPILLAADDDHTTEGNPGLTAARAAALAVGGLVVVPQFPAERLCKATDFNDLFLLGGVGAVRGCFAEMLEGLNNGL